MASLAIWGPIYWNFFHTMAATYPHAPTLQDRVAAMQFFSLIPQLVPCPACRVDSTEYLRQHVKWSDVSSRTNLFIFFWKFHNHVNAKLGKATFSLADAKKKFLFQ